MASKRVSRRYALNEFNTIGLILIIYSLFVLFLPLVINELMSLMFGEVEWFGLDVSLLVKVGLMIIGTILPFSLLKLASKKKYLPESKKIKISSKQIVCQALVFFTLTSAAIFATTAIAAYFGMSGELVSGVGITIDSNKITDIVYIVTFIIITPILEEYAFRGVLLRVLSKYGKYFALIISSIIFSLAHGSFMEFIPSFVMGLLLGKISLRYKSIKPTIWIHIIFNLLLYFSFIVPEKFSMYVAVFYALIYVISIALMLSKTYKRIIVKKSQTNSKVSIMFLTTFTVMVSIFLFIASSILTILLR